MFSPLGFLIISLFLSSNTSVLFPLCSEGLILKKESVWAEEKKSLQEEQRQLRTRVVSLESALKDAEANFHRVVAENLSLQDSLGIAQQNLAACNLEVAALRIEAGTAQQSLVSLTEAHQEELQVLR